MTIESQAQKDRIKTKMANLARQNLHRNCSVDIRAAGPHWGLYCANPRCPKTGSWLQWVNKQNLKSILQR
jgi:hypothetical protein